MEHRFPPRAYLSWVNYDIDFMGASYPGLRDRVMAALSDGRIVRDRSPGYSSNMTLFAVGRVTGTALWFND
jgi:hypothetical protein